MATHRILILIAEDHDATRKVLAKMLTRRGYEVQEAENGHDALNSVTGKLDLLICDIGLPDMSGWELLRKFHEKRPEVPAIAVTGYGRAEEIEASVKAGFLAHLTKPITIAQVEAAIQKTLARHHAA
jgi:two-component system CheB/CheR fusion protein